MIIRRKRGYPLRIPNFAIACSFIIIATMIFVIGRTIVPSPLFAFFIENEHSPNNAGNSLMATLQTVRSQIEFYKIQHEDHYPTLDKMRDWSAMLQKSDAQGCLTPDGRFGPYLAVHPCNSLSGNTETVAKGHPTKDAGWTYDERTGELKPIVTHAAFKVSGLSLNNCSVEFIPDN